MVVACWSGLHACRHGCGVRSLPGRGHSVLYAGAGAVPACGRGCTLGAFRRDSGAPVGSYCLFVISPGVYELGYWAVKEQRGRGYSVEAARALCDWGWATLDVDRIERWAMVGNTGSRAVAEKLGYTVEGTLRNCGIANDGKAARLVGGRAPEAILRP
nr:GNAT family protein [Streptomyces mutomycini]